MNNSALVLQAHSAIVLPLQGSPPLSSSSFLNTPTPFKLDIGLAFVGVTEEESIGALITAIHYPNKHGTQPLLDTDLGDVKCLARDKGLDRESLLH